MLTEVHVPEEVESVARLVSTGARVMGGGTSLMPWLNDYASAPIELVSLRKAGLSGVEVDGSTITIGAATTLAQIEADDRVAMLNPVVRSIASLPVRNLATVGGNLFARQPHGDLAVALVALDARADLTDAGGTSREAVERVVTDAADVSGLVTAVSFSRPEPASFKYLKAARRRFNSVSIGTVAARLDEEDGVVSRARVARGGLGPHVIRAHAVEAALIGNPLDLATVEAAAAAGLGEIEPHDDAYASAWYRARVFPVHLRRALLGS